MKYLLFIATFLCHNIANSQSSEYLGAGNDESLTIFTSSNFFNTTGDNTANGKGLDAEIMEASRFLAQSTLGFNLTDAEQVQNLGFENWIDFQTSLAPTYLSPHHDEIFTTAKEIYDMNKDDDDEDYYGPWGLHFNYAWWQVNMTNEDLLRHRVALALSEILVISMNSDLIDFGEGLSDYYDLFVKHAFGNYKDLLMDVTLHPCMGYYLSHLSNPKTDEENKIHPDENYAREIMQLFTIGLYELNPDGSRQLDGQGNFIPTYDNNDIRELAKVFTGLSGSEWSYQALEYFEMNGMTPPPVVFGEGIYTYSREGQMKMYEDQHESGSKTILKNHIIPNGQTGLKDVTDAINILFEHDNLGPFLGRFLIQRLVKSNPSPAYIQRITNVFNDNGSGARGDLGAVVKSILMDEEARSCEWQQAPTHGMLREPIVRYLHFARAIPTFSPMEYYWNNGFTFRENTKQHPFISPTVFNFFLPDYQPVGDFSNEGIYGPEFQIHDTQSSVGYINEVNQWTIFQTLFFSFESFDDDLSNNPFVVSTELSELAEKAQNTEELINYLDKSLTHGRLSDETRQIIREAISILNDPSLLEIKAAFALYLIMISPDYTILK